MTAAAESAHSCGEPPSIVVIGGGLTGLAAAHRLQELAQQDARTIRVVLIEASGRLGGLVGTIRIDGELVETGADSFITNKPWGVDLCRRLGIEDQLIQMDRQHAGLYVLRAGRPQPVPEGFSLLSPGKRWPVLKSPLFSVSGKLRILMEPLVPARRSAEDESLADFARRRLGNECFERLVQPLVGGIYTSDPERLSMQATLKRFADAEERFGSLARGMPKISSAALEPSTTGVRYGLFTTPRDGISTLVDKLAERVSSGAEIRLESPVKAIARSPSARAGAAGGWTVHLADEAAVNCEGLIVATGAQSSSQLLSAAAPDLATALGEIEHASSAIVVSSHAESDFEHLLDAYGLIIPHCEGRRILAVSFASRKFAGRVEPGRVLTRTFVGGALQPELLEQPDAQIEALVQAELQELLGLHAAPKWMRVCRYPRAMPQYHVGHCERVRRLRELEQELPALRLAGNAFDGVGIPDVIHSGEQAAESIWSTLPA